MNADVGVNVNMDVRVMEEKPPINNNCYVYSFDFKIVKYKS